MSAVRSASYFAECASLESQSRPQTCAAFASTVCPNAAPASVAVSKHENGWNGLRLMSARATAALRNPRSNAALCPTSTARRQSTALIAARTSVNIRPSASFSGSAGRSG